MKLLVAALAASALVLGACSDGRGSAAPAPSTPAASVPAPDGPATTGPSTAAPAPSAAPLQWSRCEVGFECATLPVPLVAAEPERGTVDLALTRRRAEGFQRVGSLVVNPGGPGASAVDYLQEAWQSIPQPVRSRFDLVAFDPRGVGRSAPVRCASTEELDRYFALDPSPDDPGELAALDQGNRAFVEGCRSRSGSLLPHVSTEEVALDLDAVRAAVGDETLTYLGYSYGTDLGASYLDRFPTRVRAMVLDGGVDPRLTWDAMLEGQSAGFDKAFEAFLADCERTRCAFRAAVNGPLGAAYDRLAAKVDATPLPGRGPRTVGPGELTLGVGAGLYDKRNGWPAIAEALAAAIRGDGAPLLSLNDSYLQRGPDGYANLIEANLAVNCTDRPWPREIGPYLALSERVERTSPRFGPAIALSGLACAVWPAPPVGQPHPVTAPGAPPVVVIGTTGDPATPFAWSEALADQLSSGVLITYRGEGHTVYRAGAPICVREPVDRYLITGTAPDASTC